MSILDQLLKLFTGNDPTKIDAYGTKYRNFLSPINLSTESAQSYMTPTPTPTQRPTPTPTMAQQYNSQAQASDTQKAFPGYTNWTPPSEYIDYVNQSSQKYNVPPAILASHIQTENGGWNPNVADNINYDIVTGKETSRDRGWGQFNDKAYPKLGPDIYRNPQKATDLMAQILSGDYKYFNDWTKASAAYNRGRGNINKKGIDDLAKKYLDKIFANLKPDLINQYGLSY